MSTYIDLRERISALVVAAMQEAVAASELNAFDIPEAIPVEPSRHQAHGDYGTPVCLGLAKVLHAAPIKIAQAILPHIPEADFLDRVEVAPPGFINFVLNRGWLASRVEFIIEAGETWGNVNLGKGQRLQVEFVSANPVGPITVASTRNAVIGDSLATVLSAAGYDVSREYYVNDTGSKITNFGGSILSRYGDLFGEDIPFPEKGYPGSYVGDLAKRVKEEAGDHYLHMDKSEAIRALGLWGIDRILEGVKADLASLNVVFDTWFSESSL